MEDLLRTVLAEPTLDAEEERALALASRAGDEDARATLVRRSLRLVALRVRALGVRGPAAEDAFQAGVLALMAATERFDPDRGARLATYAWPWITRAVRDEQRRSAPMPPVPPVPDEAGERGPDLVGMLAQLPADQVAVVRLRHGLDAPEVGQRTWEQVAQRLGTPPGRARRLHDRAMTQLRAGLARVGDRAPHAGAGPP